MKLPRLFVLLSAAAALAFAGCERHDFETTRALHQPHGEQHEEEEEVEARETEGAGKGKGGAPRETGL